MASFLTYTTLFSLVSTFSITIPTAFSQQFAEEIATMRLEKVSHLHFYFHDILSGKNPTAMQIAGPKKGRFGMTMMVDDALTEGPEPSSKLLGRAQGLYALTVQQEPA